MVSTNKLVLNRVIISRLSYMTFALVAFCCLSLFSLSSVHLSNDFRVYFSQQNPQLEAFDQFEHQFGSHDSIALLAELKTGSWLTHDNLTKIEQYTQALWQLNTVTRVDSLTNYQYTYANNDTLFTQSLRELSSNPETLRQAIRHDPQLNNTYLSPDEQLAVVHASLDLNGLSSKDIKALYQQTTELKQKFAEQSPSVNFHLVGSIVSNVTLENAVKNDLLTLVPISYLVITIGLLLFFRSIKATLFTLIITSLSILFTFSLFSLFKQEFTPVAGFVPSVVLTLAVADCVHYLTSYRYLMRVEGLTSTNANQEAFRINLAPISITSITTAIGVLFLNLSDSPPYNDLGNMVAIGVTLAWILTICILPVALHYWPIHFRYRKSSSSLLTNFSRSVMTHRKIIFISLLLLILLSAWGISRLTISENWSKYFSERFELARAVNLLKDKFDRLHRYELVLSSETVSANSPDYLNVLDQLLNYLEHQKEVKHIQSYGYTLKRLNQNMHADMEAYFTMPESQPLAAQYLLLYELSLPEGLGVDQWITDDRSATRTSILLQPMNSEQLITFEQSLTKFFNSLDTHDLTLKLSGMDHIFAHIAHRNIIQMILGSVIALLVISALIGLVLRSFKYGVISLLPNLVPGFIAYGIWGLTAGYIDLALSVVICMSLGIIVDDSVHFLTKYARAKHQLNKTTQHAIDYAFHIVGKALITTTVILVAGFATLIASPLTPTSSTGALLCLTLLVALIIDFTLLPIALKKLDNQAK